MPACWGDPADVRPYLRRLVSNGRNRAAKTGRPFELTFELVWDLWVLQDGKCAITGEPLTWQRGLGRNNSPDTNASLDQIVAGAGYCKGNVRLVCIIANKMKSDLTDEALVEWAKKVVTYAERKTDGCSPQQDDVVCRSPGGSRRGSSAARCVQGHSDTPDVRVHPGRSRRGHRRIEGVDLSPARG